MSTSLILLALTVGAIMSIYLPMIAQGGKMMGSAPLANVPFFGVAFVASVGIALASGARGSEFARIGSLPPLLWTPGLMSAGMIIGSSFLIPRIGTGPFFVLLVSGQVLAGFVFGHLGLFGVPSTPLSLARIVGAAMVLGGVYLITMR